MLKAEANSRQAETIERIARALTELCSEALGERLRAVILTGSLAREEASRDGAGRLLSDAEAVAVLRDSCALPSREWAKALCERIEARLAAENTATHVSLSVVHGEYLRRLPKHIYSYELRECGQVLAGEKDILELIPAFAAEELEREDAWRILSNRLVELAGTESGEEIEYRTVKLGLDLASSLLIFAGGFAAGYEARLRSFEALAVSGRAAELPLPAAEFVDTLRRCTAAKLRPQAEPKLAAEIGNCLVDWAWRAWRWELEQLGGFAAGAEVEAMLRGYGRGQGAARRLRGWLFAARRVGVAATLRNLPRWLGLATQGMTPRHGVYLAAYLGNLANRESEVAAIRSRRDAGRLLAVSSMGQGCTRAELARQLAWNYQEFVTETRA